MNGFRYTLRFDVVHEFFDRIVPANPEIVAKHARDRRVGEPAHVLAKPDVMMRIDGRAAVRHFFLVSV